MLPASNPEDFLKQQVEQILDQLLNLLSSFILKNCLFLVLNSLS